MTPLDDKLRTVYNYVKQKLGTSCRKGADGIDVHLQDKKQNIPKPLNICVWHGLQNVIPSGSPLYLLIFLEMKKKAL